MELPFNNEKHVKTKIQRIEGTIVDGRVVEWLVLSPHSKKVPVQILHGLPMFSPGTPTSSHSPRTCIYTPSFATTKGSWDRLQLHLTP